MKKYLPLVLILAVVLLGGGAFLASKNKSPKPDTTDTAVTRTGGDNIITSIRDALTKSASLECSYQDEKGTQTKTYMKNGAVSAESKMVIEGKETNSRVILKDNKMYTWDTETKQGVTFTIPPDAVENTQEEAGSKKDEFIAELEKYKDACKAAIVSDSLFTIPADVRFQDLSLMMENLPDLMKETGNPSGFDPEELKKQFSPEE